VVLITGNKNVVAVPSNYDAFYFYKEDGSFRFIAPLGAGEAPSRGTPALADGRMYIATRSTVVALQLK
jgi:hypothetical protein